MVRNFVFGLMGLLVGLAVFTYGFASRKPAQTKNVASKQVTDPRVDEIKRNVIIDPVEIQNPDAHAAEVNANAKTAAVGAPVQTPPTQFAQTNQATQIQPQASINGGTQTANQTQAPAQNSQNGEQGATATNSSLAKDIIPATPAAPETVVDEGWANAGFLPDDVQSNDTDNSVLEEEVVQ